RATVHRRSHVRRPAHQATPAAHAAPIGDGALRPVARELGAWLRAIPGWSAERRSRAVALGAILLLLIALVMVVVARVTVRHGVGAPQVGGGDDPVPGFAVVPGQTVPGKRSAGPGA